MPHLIEAQVTGLIHPTILGQFAISNLIEITVHVATILAATKVLTAWSFQMGEQ